MQPAITVHRLAWLRVSILTRPGGRVQHDDVPFSHHSDDVSILPRPVGRVQRGACGHTMRASVFQSSPDPEAGCNPLGDAAFGAMRLFQSSPDPEAGCNGVLCGFGFVDARFQSSPDPEAGCNIQCRVCQLLHSPVSILTRPGGRVQPGDDPLCGYIYRVSILTRPGGRVQRYLVCIRPRP